MNRFRVVTAPDVPEPPAGLFSNCLVVGNTIHISGQHAGTREGATGGSDMFAQTQEALRRMRALIEAAGGTIADIVKLTIYVTDMSRKAEVSRARRTIFTDPMPCSTLVGVQALAEPGLLVEIDAVAILGAGP